MATFEVIPGAAIHENCFSGLRLAHKLCLSSFCPGFMDMFCRSRLTVIAVVSRFHLSVTLTYSAIAILIFGRLNHAQPPTILEEGLVIFVLVLDLSLNHWSAPLRTSDDWLSSELCKRHFRGENVFKGTKTNITDFKGLTEKNMRVYHLEI
ncbi:hypothetical protein ACJX0J_036428 [Zea mays]